MSSFSRASSKRPPKRSLEGESTNEDHGGKSSSSKKTSIGELVWVTHGATQHPAHLLESSSSAHKRQPRKCLVQWVSTGEKDWVPARHVQRQLLSRKRPKRTSSKKPQQHSSSPLPRGRRGRPHQQTKPNDTTASYCSVDKLMSSNASASSTIESLSTAAMEERLAQEAEQQQRRNLSAEEKSPFKLLTSTMHELLTISIPSPDLRRTPSPREVSPTTIIRRAQFAPPADRGNVSSSSLPPHLHDLVYGEDRPTLYKGTALEGRDQTPSPASISSVIFWVLEQLVIAGLLYVIVKGTNKL